MHEMALTLGILDILKAEAARQGFRLVRRVRLELGALSHADPEAMAFCFPAVMAGTLAEGAELEILRTPGEAWCLGCDSRVPLARRGDPCPACGGARLQVVEGTEMRIMDLEVV